MTYVICQYPSNSSDLLDVSFPFVGLLVSLLIPMTGNRLFSLYDSFHSFPMVVNEMFNNAARSLSLFIMCS